MSAPTHEGSSLPRENAITIGLRPEAQKAKGFPKVPLLKLVSPTALSRRNTNTHKPMHSSEQPLAERSRKEYTQRYTPSSRDGERVKWWGGYIRRQQLQSGWLPSKARAASTRWDQSRPEAVSGRGMRPGSLNLDLSAKEPSENQNSSAETGRHSDQGLGLV